MATMRIRKPFAASFVALLLLAAYLGLSTNKIPRYGQSDKALHFVTFFLLTLTFYWILETSRRRLIHLSMLLCTAGLSIGSEVAQSLLPNGRAFDPVDILANVLGSALALLMCSWYHKRMLERKRASKSYQIVPGDEDVDVELGEGVGVGAGAGGRRGDVGLAEQEVGVVHEQGEAEAHAVPGAAQLPQATVTQQLDNWDENAEDWEDEATGTGTSEDGGQKTPGSSVDDGVEKKRVD